MRRHACAARGAIGPLLGAALVLCAPDAAAQTTPAANAAAARERFDRGVAFMREARWDDAAREFEAAGALYRTAPLLYNLGLVRQAQGRRLDAIAALEQFLALGGATLAAARRQEVEARIASMRRELGTVRVTLDPPHATLRVDGADTLPRADGLRLDPGAHVLEGAASGYVPTQVRVSLAPGGEADAAVRLAPRPDAGHLLATSGWAGARWTLDQRPAGASPRLERLLDPGRHRVGLTAPDGRDAQREVVIEPRATLQLRLPGGAGSGAAGLAPGVWVGLAIGAVVLVGVGVALAATLGPSSPAPRCGTLGNLLDTSHACDL